MGDGYGEVPNCQPNGRITKVVKPNTEFTTKHSQCAWRAVYNGQNGTKSKHQSVHKEREPMNPQKIKNINRTTHDICFRERILVEAMSRKQNQSTIGGSKGRSPSHDCGYSLQSV